MALLQDSLALHQGSSTHNLCLHTHTHFQLNKQKFNTGRLSLYSRANSESPEYVSASPNDASTRRDTKEEQTGARDGCEKPSLAVTLTSLSLTLLSHTRRQPPRQVHTNQTCLRKYSFLSLNVYSAPIMPLLPLLLLLAPGAPHCS